MKDEKILKDELMTDEELEKVAGGTAYEMVKDSQFLHAIGLMDHEYGISDITSNIDGISEELNQAFGKIGMSVEAGVNFIHSYSGDDQYELGRAEAYKMVCDKIKPGFDYKQFL